MLLPTVGRPVGDPALLRDTAVVFMSLCLPAAVPVFHERIAKLMVPSALMDIP